jgi:hypothetical protein
MVLDGPGAGCLPCHTSPVSPGPVSPALMSPGLMGPPSAVPPGFRCRGWGGAS